MPQRKNTPPALKTGARHNSAAVKARARKSEKAHPGADRAETKAACGQPCKSGPSAALRAKAAEILELLRARYPRPQTHLDHKSAWELLVATVLAAQCTDARVNTVTPALFARWPGPAEMAGADIAELEEAVRPTGFYHNKARHLLATARRLRDAYGGEVPSNMTDLLTLPGLGRKTANVVLFGAFGINAGLAVDTHVGRIAWRLGLTSSRDPVRAEKELCGLFPREEWGDLNHRLVWFGRQVCKARGPLCGRCEMERLCEKRGLAPAVHEDAAQAAKEREK